MLDNTQLTKLLHILDVISVSIYWKDKVGKYLGCNKYMLDMVGLERGDVIGKTDKELVWSGIADKLQQIDSFVVSNNIRYEVEETPELADISGRRIYLSTKVPLKDTYGNSIGVIGVSVDITERERNSASQIGQTLLRMLQLAIATDILEQQEDMVTKGHARSIQIMEGCTCVDANQSH